MLRIRLFVLIAAAVFIGQGCPQREPALELPEAPPAAEADRGPVTEQEVPPLKPFYVSFSQEAFRQAKLEKRAVLLYFWAAWCPVCRAEEPKVKGLVESLDLPIAGFRVNYDSERDLKKEFRIPYQHTVVILNKDGAESARFSGPISDADLRAALEAAAR